MLTALAAEQSKLKALTIGVDDYLAKPFSILELLTRVQNLLYNYEQRKNWQMNERNSSLSLRESKPEFKFSKTDKEWVDHIEKLVHESFETKILNVEELAAHLFISKKQLTRKMKTFVGITPGKFIKEVQLNHARKVLENGLALSIKEVAYNNGFDSPSSFSTAFKKHFGKSPKEYFKH